VSKLRWTTTSVQSVAQRVELENVSLKIRGNDIRVSETMLSESSLGCLPRSTMSGPKQRLPKKGDAGVIGECLFERTTTNRRRQVHARVTS
jgi:hypothetical protein